MFSEHCSPFQKITLTKQCHSLWLSHQYNILMSVGTHSCHMQIYNKWNLRLFFNRLRIKYYSISEDTQDAKMLLHFINKIAFIFHILIFLWIAVRNLNYKNYILKLFIYFGGCLFLSVYTDSVSVIGFLWFLVLLLPFAVHPLSPIAYKGHGLLGLSKCQRPPVSLNMWRNSRQEICFQRYIVTIPS